MTRNIVSKLKKFGDIVRNEISEKSKLIIFGSVAKGKNKRWSDIDVVVVVPHVKDRIQLEIDLRLKSLQIDERINPFVFTYKEMKENSPLIWEVKKHGKEI